MPLFVRALLIAVAAALPLACSAAEAPKYKLGKDYLAVRTPQTPADPARIEVMEIFAYSCPHCFSLEGPLQAWLAKKPDDVNFIRLPHTLGSQANALRNKAMYTAHMLGALENFHRALFGAIHGQGKMMSTPEELRALFEQSTGIKGEEFDGAYKSFVVDSRNRIAEQAVRDIGVTSVPTLVVDGKYAVSPRAGGGPKEMFAIVDFLVDQARKERGKSR